MSIDGSSFTCMMILHDQIAMAVGASTPMAKPNTGWEV